MPQNEKNVLKHWNSFKFTVKVEVFPFWWLWARESVDKHIHTHTNLTAGSCYGPKQLQAGQGPAGTELSSSGLLESLQLET